MLQITIPAREFYNNDEFFYVKEYKLSLEHSLVSIAKWEAKWHKPFISDDEKTVQEQLDYVKCMTITQRIPSIVYGGLSNSNMEDVQNYIANKRTATFFVEKKNPRQHGKGKKETITSELIYYWMISLEIPFECQKWHLNRLLTLIRICNIKNNKNPKKMGKKDTLKNNHKLNEARRAKGNTSG